MWLPLALLAAVLYASLWLFARASRGIPSGVVTTVANLWAPFLLIYTSQKIDYPWHETWWQIYLIMPFIIIPLVLRLLTFACQRTQVTIVNPLASLSTLSTLAIATIFFAKSFSYIHLLGISVITAGLLCLYGGRWQAWRKPWPWLVLLGVLVLGVNVAIIKEVLDRLPYPIALLALAATGTFSTNALLAGKSWAGVRWNKHVLLLLGTFALANLSQDVFTFFALSLGPAPHVIAVKRTSILFAAIGAYIIFRERDQSLIRLLVSCVIVVVGVVLLNV